MFHLPGSTGSETAVITACDFLVAEVTIPTSPAVDPIQLLLSKGHRLYFVSSCGFLSRLDALRWFCLPDGTWMLPSSLPFVCHKPILEIKKPQAGPWQDRLADRFSR